MLNSLLISSRGKVSCQSKKERKTVFRARRRPAGEEGGKRDSGPDASLGSGGPSLLVCLGGSRIASQGMPWRKIRKRGEMEREKTKKKEKMKG